MIGEFTRARPRRGIWETFADLLVDGLNVTKDRVPTFREHVLCTPESQMSFGANEAGRLMYRVEGSIQCQEVAANTRS